MLRTQLVGTRESGEPSGEQPVYLVERLQVALEQQVHLFPTRRHMHE